MTIDVTVTINGVLTDAFDRTVYKQEDVPPFLCQTMVDIANPDYMIQSCELGPCDEGMKITAKLKGGAGQTQTVEITATERSGCCGEDFCEI